MSPDTPTRSTVLGRRADLALRCAWLRAHASELHTVVDPSGQLSAQLLDLADLLEVAEREGWWDR